jgi:hypothetical protein
MVSSLNYDEDMLQQFKTRKNNRTKIKGVLLAIMLLLSTTIVLADPGAGDTGLCDGVNGGPDGCPLDTWVWALTVIAIIFAVSHLKKKQRQIADK